MSIAIIFPGQGSQQVGMGLAAYEISPAARAVFAEADEALGEPLSRLCFEGPEEDLRLTANTQPAMLVTSIALFRALDVPFDVCAGHSLGEYTAHVAAGTFTLADAVRLVRKRGVYMQEAVPDGAGAMAAILRGDAEMVAAVCAQTPGVVEPVNYNAPGQVVIAGEAPAVEAASRTLEEKRSRAMSLPVSAPFHSSLMRPAEERLAPELAAVSFNAPQRPVYCNVDALAVTDAASAEDSLKRQVSRPVLWQQSVQRMVEDGVTLFVEVGPGKVLTGTIKRIAKGIACLNVEGPADFGAARDAIQAQIHA